MVTAYQGDQVDAIVQFDVLSGKQRSSTTRTSASSPPEAALHRQIWMRTDTGAFADKKVRQALALTFDRPALIQQLFQGKAQLGNDHVIWQGYPYFDSTVPQRAQDIDKAKALLAEAGVTQPDRRPCMPASCWRSPTSRRCSRARRRRPGITLNVAVESLDTFYGAQWCPADPADPPCSGAAELGIVDYGHRATPDVYLNAALKSKGIWNSSQYGSTAFDAAFTGVPERGRRRRPEGGLHQDRDRSSTRTSPIGLPYFYNYLAGNSKKFTGVYSSALGQMFFSAASRRSDLGHGGDGDAPSAPLRSPPIRAR